MAQPAQPNVNTITGALTEIRDEIHNLPVMSQPQIGQQLEQVLARLDGIDQRLDGIDQRLDEVNEGLANIEDSIENA
jgi:chromosome segregation ATPase